MASQALLVEQLVANRVVKSKIIVSVLKGLDRRHFCLPETPDFYVYQDAPTGIGCNQTISAPHMHATCLELCKDTLQKGPNVQVRVLDVGSGSGYLTAAFALLLEKMEQPGCVVGIEKYEKLAEASRQSILQSYPELMKYIEISSGNAWENVGEDGFDVIHVGAAAADLPPSLVHALRPGGRMVIPVGPEHGTQVMKIVDKREDGTLTSQDLMAVRYVPLTRH